MNGDTAMPTIQFGESCDYGMLDDILNGYHSDDGYGWGVRVWLTQGVIVTARWGKTYWGDDHRDHTSLLAWSESEGDYCKPITVPTDDITRLEIL